MEKMIYTNSLGQTIEFSATSKYKWQKVDDIGGTDAASQTIKSPYQDGVTGIGESYFESKVIKLDFAVISETLDADMRALYNVLNPKLGMASLTIVNNGQYYQFDKVKTRSLPTRLGAKDRGPRFQLSNVIFEVYDPFLTDYNQTEVIATSGASTFKFPIAITNSFKFGYFNVDGFVLENNGDVPAPLEIIIDGAQISPLEIQNTVTGEKIVISLSLTADERLTITTALDNINVIKTTLSTGVQVSAFEYIDASQTEFFQLETGENNIVIKANQTDVGSATLRFKQRYVGI